MRLAFLVASLVVRFSRAENSRVGCANRSLSVCITHDRSEKIDRIRGREVGVASHRTALVAHKDDDDDDGGDGGGGDDDREDDPRSRAEC